MCYGGHQFGVWAGQLGDGRAINLGELNCAGRSWMLQLKGAGETPYSRTADGLAVLRSSIREHLCSEAMHYLGVPTTRSLCLIETGDEVLRDIMYDGRPRLEPGAVICRVAPTFIRFGNFEIAAARQDLSLLRSLADFTIRHHYPELAGEPDGYAGLFRGVAMRTLTMVLHWQRVGFVHGVMNTDNMSILGETIDYGPYGWLDDYDPGWTPNTTDRERRRYRYGHQPQIALWNLLQLANALFPLVNEPKPFEEVLQEFQSEFEQRYMRMMAAKLGLETDEPSDRELIRQLEAALQLTETDMTLFFRNLSAVRQGQVVGESGKEFLDPVIEAFYSPDELADATLGSWREWFARYVDRLRRETCDDVERATRMNQTNPRYVLRNYMAQMAIECAEQGDASMISELFELLKNPYAEQPDQKKWFARRPDWARNKVGCSMLSCSS
jgi:uncharacterized protein YdiU (UPF0061 family)